MQAMPKTPGRALWSLVRQHIPLYAAASLFTVLNVFIGFMTPALLAELFDHHLGSHPSRLPAFIDNALLSLFGSSQGIRQNLWVFGVAIIVIHLLKGAFSYLKGIACAKASEESAQSMRDGLYRHLQRLPFDYHVKAATGDLLQRCTTDVETVRRFLNVQLMSVFNSILMVAVALMLMMPVSTKVTLLSMLPLPIMLVFSWKFFAVVINAYKRAEEAEGAMSTVLQENLTGIRVVRAFGQQQSEVEKFENANSALLKKQRRIAPIEAMYWTSGDVFNAIQTLIITGACILEAQRGVLTVGDIVVLVTYSSMLMGPTRQLGRILSEAGRSLVALGRIIEIANVREEKPEPDAIRPPLSGDIVFDHVFFSYDGQNNVLDDLCLTIRGGATSAFLGATGSGKSTLMMLLQRLYEPTQGRITIGGIPLEKIDRTYLRKHVGLILQEPFLYSKTIRQNIGIVAENADQQALERAVRDAEALDFITQSENGFETLVGERGVTLSGGQKQRVAIARTLMKDNDILIFDDSLSAVDTETDAAIREKLRERNRNTTTLIISHRISTLSQADQIFVMDGGRIMQSGTHDSLIGQDGLYKRIYEIQKGNAAIEE